MDETWERAVESALADGVGDVPPAEPRSLTLDGAVKCLHGRLPSPNILERYQTLERLSIANVGVSTLENFPRLKNLRRLSLTDNRIAGGLEFLVEAGLFSLRDLDLSNNRIQFVEDLAPLAQLRIVSLDLYECPVTRIADYRSRVFSMIGSVRYLDKLDANGDERIESDEDEEDEDEEEEDYEEDPGSGEVDGGDSSRKLTNGGVGVREVGVFDEDEESDADEETDGGGLENGYRVVEAATGDDVEVDEDDDGEDEEDDYDEDLGEEEIDEEDGDGDGEDDDLVEVHDVGSSSEEDVEEVEVDEDGEDDDGEEDEEDVEDEEDGVAGSPGLSTDGEIDGHEQGEGDEDENGEIGEEDAEGVEEDGEDVEEDRDFEDGDGEDEDEDGAEFLVQPVNLPAPANENGESELDAGDDEDEEDEVDDGGQGEDVKGDLQDQPSTSSSNKRKRDDGNPDDDSVEDLRSSKHH